MAHKTLLDKIADELAKAQKLQTQSMVAQRAEQTAAARRCLLQRQAALSEALGHLNALARTIQGELDFVSASPSQVAPAFCYCRVIHAG
jgi:hypothetical protein